MPDLARPVTQTGVVTLDAELRSISAQAGLPQAGTLVAQRYGPRDWFLRRLLAVSDIGWLAVAMVLAMVLTGGGRGHAWTQFPLYGLATLPAWVVLFKLYGLYERDGKRLSH